MTQTEQINQLTEQVIQLQATILTSRDVYEIMGIFTVVLLATTFAWHKQLKTIFFTLIQTSKTDMRSMIKDMLAVRLENLDTRINELNNTVDELRVRVNRHLDKHS